MGRRDDEDTSSSSPSCCSLLFSPFMFMAIIFSCSIVFLSQKQQETNLHLEELVDAVKRLHQTHQTLNNGHDSLAAGVNLLHSTIQFQHDKLLSVEKHAKWKNVLVKGIPERRDEDSESMVRELFYKKCKIELKESDIESVLRSGRKVVNEETGHTEPRNLVVKLANYKDKVALLNKAGMLDGTPYSLEDDKELHEEMIAKIEPQTLALNQPPLTSNVFDRQKLPATLFPDIPSFSGSSVGG